MENFKVLFFPLRLKLLMVIFSLICISFFSIVVVHAQVVLIGQAADISVSDIDYKISPVPGDNGTVLVTVENLGNLSGTYSIDVFLDEIFIGVITGELIGGSVKTHRLFPGKIPTSSYIIRAGESFESFVLSGIGVELNDIKISSQFITEGESVTLSGVIANTSIFGQSYSYPVFLDGTQITVLSGHLSVGSKKAFLIDVTHSDIGYHSVSIATEYTLSYALLLPLLSGNFSIRDEFVNTTAKAFDLNGIPIQVSGTTLTISYTHDSLNIEFPVILLDDQELISFTEPKAGIYYHDNRIRMRLTRERQLPEVWIVADEKFNPLIHAKNHVFVNAYLFINHGIVPLSTDDLMPDIIYLDVKLPMQQFSESVNVKIIPKILMDPSFNELLNKYFLSDIISFKSSIIGFQIQADSIDDSGLRNIEIGVNIDRDWMSTLGGSGNFRYVWENPSDNKLEFAEVTLQSVDDKIIRISATVPPSISTFWLVRINQAIQDDIVIVSVTADSKVMEIGQTGVLRINAQNTGENLYYGILPVAYDSIPFKSDLVMLQPNQSLEIPVFFIAEEGNHFLSVDKHVTEIISANRLPDALSVVKNLQFVEENNYILVSLHNNGIIPGFVSKVLQINGVPVKELRAILDPGEVHEFKEKFINKIPGEYIITVDNQSIYMNVKQIPSPPIFSIDNLELPLNANPGDPIEVKYRLTNAGDAGIFHPTLIIGNASYLLHPVPIDSYSSFSVIDEVTVLESGELLVHMMGHQVILTVANAAEIDMIISDLKISPLFGEINKPITISAMMYNQHSFLGTDSIVLKINGNVIDQQRVWIGPTTQKMINFEYIPVVTGWTQININEVSVSFEIISNLPRYIVLFGMVGFILFISSTYFAFYSYKSQRISSG